MSSREILWYRQLPADMRDRAERRFAHQPFGEACFRWTELLEASDPEHMEGHYFLAFDRGELRALALIHVVRGMRLSDYVMPAAKNVIDRVRIGSWRPAVLDVAFLEIPLINRTGLLLSADADAGEARTLKRELVEFGNASLGVDLFCIKEEAGYAFAQEVPPGFLRFPFHSNTRLQLPEEVATWVDWLSQISRQRRSQIRREVKTFQNVNGTVEVLPATRGIPPEVVDLFKNTCAYHKAQGDMPYPINIDENFNWSL